MFKDPLALILGEWAMSVDIWSVLLRYGLSILFGAAIGCERSSKRHAAGMRTFILVCFAGTSAALVDYYLNETNGSGSYLISAAAVIALAIIAVNTVLYSSKNQIKGLTTSAALWVCGVIGILIGSGFYSASIIAFAALLLSLSLFPVFEKYLKDRSNHFEMHIELESPAKLRDFVTTLRELGMTVDDIEINPAYAHSGLSVYSVLVSINSPELKKYKTHKEVIEALRSLEYLNYIEEMK